MTSLEKSALLDLFEGYETSRIFITNVLDIIKNHESNVQYQNYIDTHKESKTGMDKLVLITVENNLVEKIKNLKLSKQRAVDVNYIASAIKKLQEEILVYEELLAFFYETFYQEEDEKCPCLILDREKIQNSNPMLSLGQEIFIIGNEKFLFEEAQQRTIAGITITKERISYQLEEEELILEEKDLNKNFFLTIEKAQDELLNICVSMKEQLIIEKKKKSRSR